MSCPKERREQVTQEFKDGTLPFFRPPITYFQVYFFQENRQTFSLNFDSSSIGQMTIDDFLTYIKDTFEIEKEIDSVCEINNTVYNPSQLINEVFYISNPNIIRFYKINLFN